MSGRIVMAIIAVIDSSYESPSIVVIKARNDVLLSIDGINRYLNTVN